MIRARRASLAVTAVALAARLAVAAWAAPRFPAIDDGFFYLRIAARMAAGLGYTVAEPDGSITHTAFYPVGYPAMVAAAYTLTGPQAFTALALNALLGALCALAAHRLALRAASDRAALAAGLLVALHPALVLSAAVPMTDGVVAALVTCAAAVAAWARDRERPAMGAALSGLLMGAATLVRPQSVLLAPVIGLLAGSGAGRLRRAAATAAAATLAALLVCAPWTARNCLRMKRCALVSYNGGWNLLVSTGDFQVPAACREVFDEAEKDACFGRGAREAIRARPGAWLSRAPGKLAGTFDYNGYAPWYLHASNPEAFPLPAKVVAAAAETVLERLALLGALVWAARGVEDETRRRRIARRGMAVVGAVFAVTIHAWIGYAAFVAAACLRGRALPRGPVLGGAAVGVVAATMATHAVFFGLGRYATVVFPLVTALGALALAPSTRRRPP